MIIFPLKKVDLFSTKAQDTSASLQALMCWERISKSLFIWRKVGPGTRGTLLLRANWGEPSFPTIAYKSSLTVYMRNCKPGSGGRVTLGVGSLGW